MEKVIVSLNGVNFDVLFDKDALIDKVKNLEVFEDDTFTEFEQIGKDAIIDAIRFQENVESFCESIERACEDSYIAKVVSYIEKKKNGTFYKNRKYVVDYYGNTHFFTEWHNTWGTYELRFKVVDDTTLMLEIVSYNHTPA